jgi:hypothetical protein
MAELMVCGENRRRVGRESKAARRPNRPSKTFLALPSEARRGKERLAKVPDMPNSFIDLQDKLHQNICW